MKAGLRKAEPVNAFWISGLKTDEEGGGGVGGGGCWGFETAWAEESWAKGLNSLPGLEGEESNEALLVS